jgi:hypothetical protein
MEIRNALNIPQKRKRRRKKKEERKINSKIQSIFSNKNKEKYLCKEFLTFTMFHALFLLGKKNPK